MWPGHHVVGDSEAVFTKSPRLALTGVGDGGAGDCTFQEADERKAWERTEDARL